MAHNPHKQLNHDLVKRRFILWYCLLKRLFYSKYGIKPTPGILGQFYPTTRTLRVKEDMDHVEFGLFNTYYWSRIERCERTVKDKQLIARVEEDLIGTTNILDCALLDLLLKPSASDNDLGLLTRKLSPKLKGKIFDITNDGLIIQKNCYWNCNTIELANSKEFLAYQLIMMRKKKLNKINKVRSFSLGKATLLFLRVLLTTPLGCIADSLLLAYYRYIHTNTEFVNSSFPCLIDEPLKENILNLILQASFPKIKIFPDYMDSFDAYRAYHFSLTKQAEKAIFESPDAQILSFDFHTEIFYLADRYSDLWLNQKITKMELFDSNRKEFKEIYQAWHFSKFRHRIWSA